MKKVYTLFNTKNEQEFNRFFNQLDLDHYQMINIMEVAQGFEDTNTKIEQIRSALYDNYETANKNEQLLNRQLTKGSRTLKESNGELSLNQTLTLNDSLEQISRKISSDDCHQQVAAFLTTLVGKEVSQTVMTHLTSEDSDLKIDPTLVVGGHNVASILFNNIKTFENFVDELQCDDDEFNEMEDDTSLTENADVDNYNKNTDDYYKNEFIKGIKDYIDRGDSFMDGKEHEYIEIMKNLWVSMAKKPMWISLEEIENYGKGFLGEDIDPYILKSDDAFKNQLLNRIMADMKIKDKGQNRWLGHEEEAVEVMKDIWNSCVNKPDVSIDDINAFNKKQGVFESMDSDDLLQYDDTFKYQMLGRLESDIKYYINTTSSPRNLWAGDEAKQIQIMKDLWNSLEVKPEWLSMEDIEKYENEILGAYGHKPLNEANFVLNLDPIINPIIDSICNQEQKQVTINIDYSDNQDDVEEEMSVNQSVFDDLITQLTTHYESGNIMENALSDIMPGDLFNFQGSREQVLDVEKNSFLIFKNEDSHHIRKISYDVAKKAIQDGLLKLVGRSQMMSYGNALYNHNKNTMLRAYNESIDSSVLTDGMEVTIKGVPHKILSIGKHVAKCQNLTNNRIQFIQLRMIEQHGEMLSETASCGATASGSVAMIPTPVGNVKSRAKGFKRNKKPKTTLETQLFIDSVRKNVESTTNLNGVNFKYTILEGRGYLTIDKSLFESTNKAKIIECITNYFDDDYSPILYKNISPYELMIMENIDDSVDMRSSNEMIEDDNELEQDLSSNMDSKVTFNTDNESFIDMDFVGIDDTDSSDKKFIVRNPQTGMVKVGNSSQIKLQGS